MSYFSQEGASIVNKHAMLAILFFLKYFFFIFIAVVLGIVAIHFREVLGEDMVQYVFFPIIFILVNYSFFKFISGVIEFYNYLFIIYKDQIFIINASLIMRNDIEVIDAFKIIKLDAYSRGFLSNSFGFGKIIIETQTKEERVFRFMPKPYKLLDILKKQRQHVLEERKKKYIVEDNDDYDDIQTLNIIDK